MQTFLLLLIIGTFICLFRVARGPTAPDRAVAIDTIGVMVVGICGVFGVITGKDYYLNVAIAWALLAFIGTLALAKYLEGRGFDE
ncbi:MAG: cation:proton antiporter [Candidatus Eisenbacteria bacterium]|nr:cation:proton antiporter [Candidatus Eisenbacteria bacterium]